MNIYFFYMIFECTYILKYVTRNIFDISCGVSGRIEVTPVGCPGFGLDRCDILLHGTACQDAICLSGQNTEAQS